MKEVQLASLKKALATLNILGCKYAVIDSDGNRHGDLEIVQKPERKRASPTFPRGEFTTTLRHSLKTWRSVKWPKYPVENMASNAFVEASALGLYATEVRVQLTPLCPAITCKYCAFPKKENK